jgi:hypothetical protein
MRGIVHGESHARKSLKGYVELRLPPRAHGRIRIIVSCSDSAIGSAGASPLLL